MSLPILFDTLLRERTAALLQSAADYGRYARHLSSRLHKLRRVLKVRRRVTAKISGKMEVLQTSSTKYKVFIPTASELVADKRFVGLLLLSAERAWAQAMETKATMENNSGAAPAKKRHVLSKFEKARKSASTLVALFDDASCVSLFTDAEKLQVVSYTALLAASGAIETRKYSKAAGELSVAYMGLQGLILNLSAVESFSAYSDDASDIADLYRDLLVSTVEPALKFATSQIDPSTRSEALVTIATKYVGPDHIVRILVGEVVPDDGKAQELLTGKSDKTDALESIHTISWRSHMAEISSSSIAASIVSARTADEALFRTIFDSNLNFMAYTKDLANLFDPALIAWQDVVDAVHEEITELASNASDEEEQAKVQQLYIVSTYANYNLIARRIARDDVLAASLKTNARKVIMMNKSGKQGVSKLKALSGIYSSILQSIEQITELPGVAADEALYNGLGSLQKYYQAYKNGVDGSAKENGIHDWDAAKEMINKVDEKALGLGGETEHDNTARLLFKVDVSEARKYIESGYAAAKESEIENEKLERQVKYASAHKGTAPFVAENLGVVPEFMELDRLVDLDNIGTKLFAVPAKPVFFDTAFNFIGYENELAVLELAAASVPAEPAMTTLLAPSTGNSAVNNSDEFTKTTEPEIKRGWFWRR
ncbi:uncharacterized protein V1516DRAFT_678067 [Lipomyces oligophaga]|uniref:uncharacterized protein n=1 Tax=Lipomyces oligophaga TaxID=45792 RepID=UPI0034CE4A1B